MYGFDGKALDDVKGAILWIQDSVDNHNSYYLCHGLDFRIEKAVRDLIFDCLDDMDLGPENCTLLGGSKGGSAALLFGTKYEFKNIIASVPQTKIGTYTRHKLKETFCYMANEDQDESENVLNTYIPNSIANPISFDKNIYIISSLTDPEYAVHIDPHVSDLDKQKNFNLLLTDSSLVRAHPDVTPYNIPFILSVLYALCEGITPKYGHVSNGNGENDRALSSNYFNSSGTARLNPVARFHWCQLINDNVTFQGYAVALGEEVDADSRETTLILKSRTSEYSFPMSKRADQTIATKLYDKYYRDYTWGGFEPHQSKGIDLSKIDQGEYEFLSEFSQHGKKYNSKIDCLTSLEISSVYSGHHYTLLLSEKGCTVKKTRLIGNNPKQSVFSFSNLEFRAPMLHVSGSFLSDGAVMPAWNAGQYVLCLEQDQTVYSFSLGTTRLRNDLPEAGAYDPELYLWSNFTTPGNVGVDLELLPQGTFTGYLSHITSAGIVSTPPAFRFTKLGSSHELVVL
ncbi:hypothetical protein [Arthrobacter sp. 260]|uniref:hypothetical protein n=1 Tax=Arthrobacter sp. 260 TaxID=2735314 RepID=UPI00149136FA|nr:hypothetical protein [Arthrobacter sp. 260]NOJ60387.1 hypothetical protein [Arthrobacter sp. 260]